MSKISRTDLGEIRVSRHHGSLMKAPEHHSMLNYLPSRLKTSTLIQRTAYRATGVSRQRGPHLKALELKGTSLIKGGF